MPGDTTVTILPNGTVAAGGWTPSAGTLHGATSDNSDTTYATSAGGTYPASPAVCVLDLATTAVPAGAQIKTIALKARLNVPGGFPFYPLTVALRDAATGIETSANPAGVGSGITDLTLLVMPNEPAGAAWRQSTIDTLQVVLSSYETAWRFYEISVDVIYNQAPTVSSVAVSPVSSTQPTVTFAYSDPEGNAKERHKIKVFASSQADPDNPTAPPVWESGEVLTAALTDQIESGLANQTAYWIYVAAADVGSGGRYSPYASTSWTTLFDPVGVPLISVPYPDAAAALVENLVVQGRMNLLTKNQAGVETNTTGFTAAANCTIARSTAQAWRGAASLAATATAGGDMKVSTLSGTSGVAVSFGELYTAMVNVRTAVTLRAFAVSLEFFDAGGASLGSITAQGTEKNTRWARGYVEARAPRNAAKANVSVKWFGCAGAEIHYADGWVIAPATANMLTNSDFSEGGFDWTLDTGGGTSTAAVATGDAKFGDRYAALNKSDAGSWARINTTSYLGINPGEVYIFSAWLYCESFSGNGKQATLTFTDDAGVTIAETTFTDLPVGSWARRSLTFTVPAAKTCGAPWVAAGGSLGAGDPGSLAKIRVDGVQLERVGAGFVNGDAETTVPANAVVSLDHSDAIGWQMASYPAYVLRDSSSKHSGTYSLRLGSAAGDVAEASWVQAVQMIPVTDIATLDVSLWWQLQNVKSTQVKVQFYDQANMPIATDAGFEVFVVNATDQVGTGSWTQQTKNGIAVPEGSAWASLFLMAGWSYDGVNPGYARFDDVAVTLHGTLGPRPYAPGGWSAGGLVSSQSLALERSSDSGATWTAARRGPTEPRTLDPLATTAMPLRGDWNGDYEAPPAVNVLYRARASASDAGTPIDSVTWQYPDPVVLAITDTALKDPQYPSRNATIDWQLPRKATFKERQARFEPLGRTRPLFLADTLLGQEGQLVIDTFADAELTAVQLLRSGQRTLLLQDPDGTNLYVRLGEQLATEETWDDAAVITVGYAEVDSPTI